MTSYTYSDDDLWSSDDSSDDEYNYLAALDNLSWKRKEITNQENNRPRNGVTSVSANNGRPLPKPVDKPAAKPPVAVKSRFNRNDSLLNDIIASEKDKNKNNPEIVNDKHNDDVLKSILEEEEELDIIVLNNEKIAGTSTSNNNNGNTQRNTNTTSSSSNANVNNVGVFNDNKRTGTVPPKNKRVRVDDSEFDVKEVLNKKKAIHEKANINVKSDLNRVKNDRQFGKAFSPTVYSPEVPVMRVPAAKPSLTNTNIIQRALTFNEENGEGCIDYHPDRVLSIILDWNINWLKECGSGEVPNTLSPWGEGTGLKTCYESLEEYQAAYIPLILLETWAQAIADYEKADQKDWIFASRSPDISSDEHFIFLSIQTTVPKNKIKSYPTDGYLCILEMYLDRGGEQKKYGCFGYIADMSTEKITSQTIIPRGLNELPLHSNPQLLKYRVLIAKKNIRPSQNDKVKMMAFYYLRPTMRQIDLIHHLNSSPLFKDILRPRSFTCQVVVPTNISLSNVNFNESQNRAILGSSEALSRPYAVPKILFVQGPPGTGKTHTLIGILKHIYRNWEQDDRLPRILICAPSNGAVDEIARRLYAERGFLYKHKNEKHHRGLRLVRIGNNSQIHPDVRKISFDSLIQDNSDNVIKGLNLEKEKKVKELEKNIQKLDQDMANHRAVGRKAELSRCEKDMQRFMLDLKRLQNSESKEIEKVNKKRLRTDIMCKADIVLSTLNSSHQAPIENLYRMYGANTFDCVIVDEASQCSEPELLMPLAWKMTKMILIGDPMQLPATVISKKASHLQFGRSLFERFFHYFREREQLDPAEKSPILMLTEQYRMHPEICQFPSLQFYDGKLISSPKVVKNRDSKLKPYIVFDVTNTTENRNNPTNKFNELEANFVIRVLSLIEEILSPPDPNQPRIYSVGVITPYNGQKNHLLGKLQNRTFKNINVEINTVDGFQGQEKDIIILSAVRASDNQNTSNKYQSIGFLDSVQRMNVALTRAKYSMILCVSARTLECDKNWKSLIDDALKRMSCRYKVPSTVKQEMLKNMLIKMETIEIGD